MKKLMMAVLIVMAALTGHGKDRIKVACFGNSITEGSGISDKITDSYPGVLQTLMGDDYEVRNYGISGYTLMLRTDRPLMSSDLFRRALEWNPDIVTIKLGSNDAKLQNDRIIATDFERDLTHMVNILEALPSRPKIYLCTPAPATAIAYNINDSIIVNKEIPIIRKVAAERGLEVIDLHESLQPYGNLFPDHVHPNEAGAVVIAGEVYNALTGEVAPKYNRPQYPGIKTSEAGHDIYTFPYWGRIVSVALPDNPLEKDNPWILRTNIGPMSDTDKALLDQGYAIVGYDIAASLGNSQSTDDLKRLIDRITKTFPLDPKQVSVEGCGLGAASALALGAALGDRLSMLLLDAPTADIKAWAAESQTNMDKALEAYSLWTWDDKRIPYSYADNVAKLGKAKAIAVFISDSGDNSSAQEKALASALREAGCTTVSIEEISSIGK